MTRQNQPEPASRHTIAFVTFLGLLPLVYFIPRLVSQWLSVSQWVEVIITVAIIVPIMSYLILPGFTKLRAWLLS
ncbi:hypothetical protein [Photobacterium sp. OFAV2-7]|uniref:hypothetical protein n=1 Tax=Photobacterium sp. OFAV2-7 TaxID=2917748 RepID=UPI001EF72968|nr:hypothetical protein [Photobacterium sp. OFAV2-7]MCG7585071.1 hypothetical protein [Photobacterium sp. OFAV2-7]